MNDIPSFAEFVEAVHDGRRPFPWHERLAATVIDEGWPKAIDAPTGLAKTSVLDVAVYALAATAREPSDRRRTPTRTMFVIDRRVVVDAAFEHAGRLRDALADPRGSEVLIWAAGELRTLTGDDGASPLEVARMRGGTTWGSQWLARPDQPAIVVGTVDQLGSRFLFRGYGVNERRRPVDAALVANDCVIFSDEAHLSQAFVETAEAALLYDATVQRPVLPLRRPVLVSMSATLPPESDGREVFRGGDERDLDHPAAAPRLNSTKWLAPVELSYMGSTWDESASVRYARGIADVCLRVVGEADVDSLLVVVNTVNVARQVFAALSEIPDLDVSLVTGRCRELDREVNKARWWGRIAAGRTPRRASAPFVLVATQTVEVGADLDADALVTECASLDALVQRLGRVDRLGEIGETRSFVVGCDVRMTHDWVYGGATRRTWDWLVGESDGGIVIGKERDLPRFEVEGPAIDAGALALRERLSATEEPDRLLPDAPRTPRLLGATLASWARTSPAPDPDEAVGPYLHGIERGAAVVNVAWRAGLPAEVENWGGALEAVSVRPGEAVEVPLASLRRLLSESVDERLSDVEGSEAGAGVDDAPIQSIRAVALRGRGKDDTVAIGNTRDLRPGDLILLDSSWGGHDEFGWCGTGARPVSDIGDLVTGRWPRRMRLHRAVIESIAPEVDREAVDRIVRDLVERVREAEDADGSIDAESVRAGLSALLSIVEDAGSRFLEELGDLVEAMSSVGGWRADRLAGSGQVIVMSGGKSTRDETADGVGDGLLLLAPATVRGSAAADSDDDTPDGSSANGLGDRVELPRLRGHLAAVAERAEEYARNLGLAPDLVEAIKQAAAAHDLGKVDRRFQAMLRGGDRLAAEAYDGLFDEMLAKSGIDPSDVGARRRAAVAAGVPRRFRHEALSAAAVAAPSDSEASGSVEVDRDLVVHLVGAHHGWGRPCFPSIEKGPFEVHVPMNGHRQVVDAKDSHEALDQPRRFEILNRRYGPFGLALLEAIVRLADNAVSGEGR